MVAVAEALLRLGVRSVVITGGHFEDYSDLLLDYWTDGEQSFWLQGEYIDTINDHGSGCSFSSAIAAALAHDYSMADALVLAKAYVTQGLRFAQQIGSGPGPVAHCGWPDNLDDLPALVESLPEQGISFEACELNLQCYPEVSSIEELATIADMPELELVRISVTADQQDASALLQQAKALTIQHQLRLIVQDDWRLAIEQQAYGVHVNLADVDSAALQAISAADLRLGVTVASYEDIARADALEVSYIEIALEDDTNAEELEQLEEWVDMLSDFYPLVASGVQADNVEQVMATGVDGVVVSAANNR
jgi:hydroxymethylpyrimidine kinase/phosphomethylpyrimidine kinase/thiamine-phosphate diphosphorylase